MKKYSKLMAIAAAAFFVSTLPTSAKEYTVEEFGKKLGRDYSTAGYVYIIGDYAFTSNHTLTMQDVMLAARSIKLSQDAEGGKTNEDPAYDEMTIHYMEPDGDLWVIGDPEVGEGELLNNQYVFNVDYINYEGVIKDYILDEVDPEVQRAVDKLNAVAAESGFKSITFDEKTKTVTFDIQDLSRFLKDYANAGDGEQNIVTLFKTVTDHLALKSIKYTGKSTGGEGTEQKEVNKSDITDANIVKFAKDVLEVMTNKSDTDILTARYVDVVGKEAKATFTFEWNDQEIPAEYTIKFTYDDDTQEENLQAAAEELNETAKNYGFSSITYEDQTLTFEIQDESALLAGYAQSDILDMFEKYIAGATKAEYTINNEKVTETFETYPTKTDGVKFAKKLLAKLAGKEESEAANLKLIDVANKEVTATVTYNINGQETTVDYTLKFVYDLVPAKDELLADDAVKLNEKVVEKTDYGFDSVTYDKTSKTVTFDIADDTALLAKFADSGIVDMFKTFAAGATKAEYTIGSDTVTENFTGNLDNSTIIGFAKKLLSKLAGVQESEAKNISLASVAGKKVTATFTYGSGEGTQTVEYTLYFQYDLKDVKNGELTDAAEELNKTIKEKSTEYGFSTVDWNEETGTATFTISDGTKDLKAFATSGIVDMFVKIATNATNASYTVNGVATTSYEENLTSMSSSEVIKFAARLLCRMAGKTFTEEEGSNNLVSVASALKTSEVAGKSAEATFTYVINGEEQTMTYKLVFVNEAPGE